MLASELHSEYRYNKEYEAYSCFDRILFFMNEM